MSIILNYILKKKRKEIKCMQGKIVLITGSTDGIGKQTAIDIAKLGATVLIHGRGKTRAFASASDVCKESGNENVEVVTGDFASLSSVRAMAAFIQQRFGHLDVLVNNAGVFTKERSVSKDGFEMTFAVNHLAPFVLTFSLLETLKTSASPVSKSRIINVSSIAHQRATMDFTNLQSERQFDGFNAYAQTKLMGIMMTYQWAERLENDNITVNCLHPGVVTTKLLQAGFGTPGGEVAAGAETSVYLASSPEVEGVTGKYFVKKQATASSPTSNDSNLRKQLWETTEKMTGIAL
jgi:NAD(P)-dependent dehydrogenase (short-subunit alcohol dehydrogenase family)